MKDDLEKTAGMSNEAVKAKTGKTWPEWFSILDKAGAKKMTHKEIVAYLNGKHGVGPWWQQMVTVSYERARGMREKHQTPQGYEISRSKTIAAPADAIYKAFTDARMRSKWLPATDIDLRTATPKKSMRIGWTDGKTSLSVNFYPKDKSKTQVVVQHLKLSNAADAKKMQAYWEKNLGKLKEMLER